jgi:hypothetical protein
MVVRYGWQSQTEALCDVSAPVQVLGKQCVLLVRRACGAACTANHETFGAKRGGKLVDPFMRCSSSGRISAKLKLAPEYTD